jgi:hypothetical protein
MTILPGKPSVPLDDLGPVAAARASSRTERARGRCGCALGDRNIETYKAGAPCGARGALQRGSHGPKGNVFRRSGMLDVQQWETLISERALRASTMTVLAAMTLRGALPSQVRWRRWNKRSRLSTRHFLRRYRRRLLHPLLRPNRPYWRHPSGRVVRPISCDQRMSFFEREHDEAASAREGRRITREPTRAEVIESLGSSNWAILLGDKGEFVMQPGDWALELYWRNGACSPVSAIVRRVDAFDRGCRWHSRDPVRGGAQPTLLRPPDVAFDPSTPVSGCGPGPRRRPRHRIHLASPRHVPSWTMDRRNVHELSPWIGGEMRVDTKSVNGRVPSSPGLSRSLSGKRFHPQDLVGAISAHPQDVVLREAIFAFPRHTPSDH